MIKDYVKDRQEDVLLMGDFNFPKIIWETNTLGGRTANEKAQGEILLNFISEYSMTQIVSAPTRQRNTLDLVITNNIHMMHSVLVTPTILSDHDMVEVNFQKRESTKTIKRVNEDSSNSSPLRKLNFHNNDINWDEINEIFEDMPWQEMAELNTVDEMLSFLMEKIILVSTANIPLRRTNSDRNKGIPRDRKVLMRNRRNVRKKLVSDSANPRHLDKLKCIENKITESHKLEKHRKETQALKAMKTNPRYFFRYA